MAAPTPMLVATEDLPAYFQGRGAACRAHDELPLAFGPGRPQYRLFEYPAPAEDETMGLFCEWRTRDFFAVDSGPHLAIGLRGPTVQEPHRGRGLAIGILANSAFDPALPGQAVPLFRGCPDPPGGPAFFIEDFSGNDGTAPVCDWQLSEGRHLPELRADGIYRIDIHVSVRMCWAGIWEIVGRNNDRDGYRFLGQTRSDPGKGEHPLDLGTGNAFIGTGFADPATRSSVGGIHIAHWKNGTAFPNG